MFFMPHLEKVTKTSSISHFLLMLGYKVFSLYFPLFLLEKGLSLPRVGFIYLLIYLPIAISSPAIGALSRKINPFFLIMSGIFGYGLYSIGMLLLPLSLSFYIFQIILGISAALFFVGNRVILISAKLDKPAKSFGFFYSAPYYAAEFAPAIGAIAILLWGFSGVFLLSTFIHIVNILYTFFSIPKNLNFQKAMNSYADSLGIFWQAIKKAFTSDIFPIFSISLVMLILVGFYRTFFLIFLKDTGWQETEILLYSSLFSMLFLPLSLLGIKILSRANVIRTIFVGGAIFAVSSVIIGLAASLVTFVGILILMEIGELGSFLANSSRSGFVAKVFSSFPHGAAVLDTVFSPLGVALGSVFGGLLIGYVGYLGIFISGGVLILLMALIFSFRLLTVENKV